LDALTLGNPLWLLRKECSISKQNSPVEGFPVVAGVAIEPPYGLIWNSWKEGRVVPFLGAGASLVGRTPGVPFNCNNPASLPSGFDLSVCLAQEVQFPAEDDREKEDLAKVSSYYIEMAGRRGLRRRLRQMLNADCQPGPLHQFLACVPAPQVIVVTNYDTLLERAFIAAGKPYDLVIYPADRKDIASSVLWWPHSAAEPLPIKPNELDIDLSKTNVIYKMHGTVRHETEKWDNFVITEEDYVEFLSRMTTNTAVPSLFYPHFRERSFLFLGYSLRDWNLRVVLKNLSKHLVIREASGGEDNEEVPPSWSIQLRPSELERRLWAKKNVNIFDLSLDDFVVRMRQKMGG
jgi:hypothetical protein